MANAFAFAAEGLQHAHSHGVVHRDVKPSNLILDAKGDLRILDFGLAWVEGQERVTHSHQRLGTPLYMSPEQVRGRPDELDAATDIYSLGVTLYEMLTWRPPFDGDTSEQILHAITHADPPLLRRWSPGLPSDLETIVLKCLHKEKLERYATAEALAQDLRRWLRGDPIEARPQPLSVRLYHRARRSRRLLGEVTAAVALVVALTVSLYLGLQEAQRKRTNAYNDLVRQSAMAILVDQIVPPSVRFVTEEREEFSLRKGRDIQWRRSRLTDESNKSLGSGANVFVAGSTLRAFASQPLSSAVQRLHQAISLLPDRPEAHYHLARALLLKGTTGAAKEHLEHALACDKRFVPAMALLANLLAATDAPQAQELRRRMQDLSRAPRPRWEPAWIEAQRAILDLRWSEASEAFDRMRFDPSAESEPHTGFTIETLLGRGLARLKGGGSHGAFDALADFSAAVTELAEWMEPAVLLGKAYFRAGRRERAEKEFGRLLARAESGWSHGATEVSLAVAAAYLELGDLEEARRWAQGAGAGTDRDELTAEILCHLGDGPGALAAARSAVSRSPQDWRAHLTVANVQLLLRDFAAAEEELRVAIRMAPESSGPQAALGVCLEAQGRLLEARRALETALSKSANDGEVCYNLARILAKLGDDAGAIHHYRKAVRIHPENGLAWNNLGTIHDRREESAAACESYRKAVKVDPTLASAHYNLAWSLHRENDYSAAVPAYEAAIRHGLASAVAFSRLGSCLLNLGRVKEAIPAYETARTLDPLDATTVYDLGVAYISSGRVPAGIECFEASIVLAPDLADNRYHLAAQYEKLGEDSKAIACCREALRLEPGYVEAHGFLSKLLLKGGRIPSEPGDLRREILRLEEAEKAPGAWSEVRWLLEACRQRLRPAFASQASIEAVLDGPEQMVGVGAVWRWVATVDSLDAWPDWVSGSFDDSSWTESELTSVAASNELAPAGAGASSGQAVSLRLRHRFVVSNPVSYRQLMLKVRASDGYIIYLNGSELERVRVPEGELGTTWNGTALRVPSRPWNFEEFEISPGRLLPGDNLLAVHVLPAARGSLGLRADASLTAAPPRESNFQERCAGTREALRAVAWPDGSNATLEGYLGGRILERAGLFAAAQARYEEALALDPLQPESQLGRARCLRATAGLAAAAESLEEAIANGLGGHRTLWESWVQLKLFELRAAPGIIADAIETMAPGSLDDALGPAGDFHWLLRELEAGKPLRINCGGDTRNDPEGNWSRDRFFRGGEAAVLYKLMSWPSARLRSQFKRVRYFAEPGRILPGYRVPLPAGSYRVVLHFVEGHYESLDQRRFGVLLEGQNVISGFEPLRCGFGELQTFAFVVPILDGALDLEFEREIEHPFIAAFEVHPVWPRVQPSDR